MRYHKAKYPKCKEKFSKKVFATSILMKTVLEDDFIASSYSFRGGSVVKNLTASTGDSGSVPELGRSPGEGDGNPLQYSCLGNAAYRGTWRDTVHRVTELGTT